MCERMRDLQEREFKLSNNLRLKTLYVALHFNGASCSEWNFLRDFMINYKSLRQHLNLASNCLQIRNLPYRFTFIIRPFSWNILIEVVEGKQVKGYSDIMTV